MGLHHTTTKAAVIRRFLLLDVGHPCTERRRAESERILRAQPFLAEATVRAVLDTAAGRERGGVRIEVETVDEIPTVFGVRFRGSRPRALRVGNGNVAGRGVALEARAERGFAYRDGYGVRVTAYQAFARPYTLAVVADRTPLGSTLSFDLGHAFITDLQRTAWHIGVRDVRGYTAFVRPAGDPLALDVRRRFADVGGVVRLGVRGRSAFVGGLLTQERVEPAGVAVVISDSGLIADSTTPLSGPFSSVNNVRLNAVVGLRSVTFLAARGFDALHAAQDVARGVQLGAVVGRGGSDLWVATDVYAGMGSGTSFAALRLEGEARHDREARRWDAMVVSGRAAWYVKPAPAYTLIAGAELSGGWRWRERIPFQLRLGARHGGVRGYPRSRVAGAVRSVARLEARRVIGQVTRHVSLGVAAFADAGRVWAGDAPFGVNSPVKAGVGAGLLAAIPPASRRLWRLDVAVPVSADALARWEVRLTVVRASGFWQEPADVARARAAVSPATIFTWP